MAHLGAPGLPGIFQLPPCYPFPMGKQERERVAQRVRELLIEARKAKGLTQGQLAELIGRTQSFVSNYERGGRRIEVADFIVIARALDRDPQEMLGRVG